MNELIEAEIVLLCQRIARVAVGNIMMREIVGFMRQCIIDEALAVGGTQEKASKLLGIKSRKIFTYKRSEIAHSCKL